MEAKKPELQVETAVATGWRDGNVQRGRESVRDIESKRGDGCQTPPPSSVA